MTATVERYDEPKHKWIFHNILHEGKQVKGILPDSDAIFEAFMLPEYKGFITTINEKEGLVATGEPAIEYWRKDPINRKKFNKFRLIPT